MGSEICFDGCGIEAYERWYLGWIRSARLAWDIRASATGFGNRFVPERVVKFEIISLLRTCILGV